VTFLPIVRRELVVAARRTGTYRQRVLFAGLATAAVTILLLSTRTTRFTGSMIFHVVAWGGFVLAALEGLRATADSISLERREGTLGLLLLTDLTGREIVAGKVAAAVVQSLTTVVAMLPAFALPVLTGGVTVGECWRVMLAFVAAVFFSLTAGALVSALLADALAAFLTAILLVLTLTIVPRALVFAFGTAQPDALLWLAGPLEIILRVRDAEFSAAPFSFWLAAVMCLLVSILMFAGAGLLLEKSPRLEMTGRDSWLQRLLRSRPGFSASWGGATAHVNPAVWLAERTLPGHRALWISLITGAVTCFLIGFFAGRFALFAILIAEVFFAYLLKLWLAAIAPQSLNASRRSGALELLLCTPLTPAELVRGQVDALYGYFMGPAMVLVAGFPAAGIAGMGIGGNAAALSSDRSPLVFGMFWFFVFLLDFHALAYAGLWFGLTNARADRAISKTVFCVLILPWITAVVPCLGWIGIIGWSVFWISWASRRLNQRFRDEMATVFSVENERSGWLPWIRAQ
jgi:hypothetical protein